MTRIGWCPGDRTVAAMLDMYPGTTVVRVFVGAGKPLPAWDGPVLGPAVTAGAVVHVSFKTWDLPAVLAWAAKKPAGVWLLLTYAHEPEQQQYGDPTVQQFHARWAEMVPAFVGHPMRDEILLGPVYTRYWWQKYAGDLRWLVTVPVDFHGWDVYNNGTTYRTPDDLLTIPRAVAARTGLPYLVAELGAQRLTTDTTGAGRSAWMRAMVAAVKADGALSVCWFHKGGCDLVPYPAEQQTWRELTQEAAVGAQRRLNWIADGSPFRLMQPAKDLRDLLRRYGYTVYDIGNTDHLEHDPPEDHTPYSATGYPGEAQYGVGYAIDIMPPPAGSVLPSLQQLGAQMLADRKAGAAGARWLKYMNWEPEGEYTGPCYHESWQPTYARRSSSDRGHIHLSGLTGYETSTIAAGYDPVARIRGEDPDMALFEQKHADAIEYMDGRVEALAFGRTTVRTGLRGAGSAVWAVQAIKALADAIGKVDETVGAQLADDFARIEQAVAAAGQADEQRDQAADAKLTELTDLVRAGQTGQLDATEVLRRMGEVLTAGTTTVHG